MSATDDREGGLLAWQLRLYPDGHANKQNLALHLVTAPMFWAGSVEVLVAPFAGWWLIGAGLVCMVSALALQGRGHKLERVPPVPFRGPGDFLARFFCEQWVNFPRFVLSGGFARAWRAP